MLGEITHLNHGPGSFGDTQSKPKIRVPGTISGGHSINKGVRDVA